MYPQEAGRSAYYSAYNGSRYHNEALPSAERHRRDARVAPYPNVRKKVCYLPDLSPLPMSPKRHFRERSLERIEPRTLTYQHNSPTSYCPSGSENHPYDGLYSHSHSLHEPYASNSSHRYEPETGSHRHWSRSESDDYYRASRSLTPQQSPRSDRASHYSYSEPMSGDDIYRSSFTESSTQTDDPTTLQMGLKAKLCEQLINSAKAAFEEQDKNNKDLFNQRVSSKTKKYSFYTSKQTKQIRKNRKQLDTYEKKLVETENLCNHHESRRIAIIQANSELKAEVAKLKQQVETLQDQSSEWPELKIRPSKEKNASEGLFTKSPIPSGACIGEYHGEKVYRIKLPGKDHSVVWRKKTDGSPEFMLSDTYVLWIDQSIKHNGKWTKPTTEKGIDGDSPLGQRPKTILRKINHKADCNLSLFVCDDDKIMVISKRDILPGEELFWDYDPDIEVDFSADKPRITKHPKRYVDVVGGDVGLKEKWKTRSHSGTQYIK